MYAQYENNIMTNGKLFKYHQEIQSFKGSIFEVFLRSKIKEFYRHNKIRINGLVERINKLRNEYFEIKDGQILQKDGKPVSLKDKDPDEYKTKMDELMKIEVNIIL